jgi:hypothetical protein
MEDMGTTKMQIFRMAAPLGQAVDSGAFTATGMEEQLFLCAMRKEPRDGATSIL